MEIQTTDAIIEQVKSLPEIELQGFFEGLKDHIHKNNYGHIVESSFPSDGDDERDYEMDGLRDEITKLSNTVSQYEDIFGKIKQLIK